MNAVAWIADTDPDEDLHLGRWAFAAAAAPDEETNPGNNTIDSQPTMQPEVKEQATEEPVIEIPPVQAPEPDIVIPPKKEVVEEKKDAVPQPKPPEPVEKPMEQREQQV